MQAALHHTYGGPDVLQFGEADAPEIGPKTVLVRVIASPVTHGDRRIRSADYGAIGALPGRLLSGLFRPRNRVPGTVFAGRVEAVGAAVTRFAVGQDVFGTCDHGAWAELLAVAEDGIIAPMPAEVGYTEAAAVPYGALTALHFMRDLAAVKPGERVAIVGAAGGVGRFAVQIARHMGAEVTGICHGRDALAVRALGAQHVVDYTAEDFTRSGQRYDVILDTAPGAITFGRARRALTATGRFLTLHLSVGILLRVLQTRLFGGPRALFGVSLGSQAELEDVAALLAEGVIRPVVGRTLPLAQIAEAHAVAETGAPGAVMVAVGLDASAA